MMDEYIERGLLLEKLQERDLCLCVSESDIKELPAADVAPVVHSRFVNMGGFPACENCGASPGTWEPKPNNQSGFPPYCYACGAKMDKEADDAK